MLKRQQRAAQRKSFLNSRSRRENEVAVNPVTNEEELKHFSSYTESIPKLKRLDDVRRRSASGQKTSEKMKRDVEEELHTEGKKKKKKKKRVDCIFLGKLPATH
ncbi:hypothetical protein OUZ56_009054 [Daphnia magna]|uniref:Uncharacterized protein n=1 Tax=Daphnia magna TaxID=35525 RepID=A0ABR0AF88_9CRUS|nr:hypothetical protein OUZ56_009054 [Daphnia magna]